MQRKKGNFSQNLWLGLGFTMPHPACGVSFRSGLLQELLYLRSECKLRYRTGSDWTKSILSILLYNLRHALQSPPPCHLHLLNKQIASSHSAALACLDKCRFNRLRGASARAARDALSTIRPKRHGVQSVGQQQTTVKVLQPCPIKLSWSPKYKDCQGYNQHNFNLKSELLYIGIVWSLNIWILHDHGIICERAGLQRLDPKKGFLTGRLLAAKGSSKSFHSLSRERHSLKHIISSLSLSLRT